MQVIQQGTIIRFLFMHIRMSEGAFDVGGGIAVGTVVMTTIQGA